MSLSAENVVEELIAALARVRAGDLSVTVSFAGADGAVGRLGREFNDTMRALREQRGASGTGRAVERLVHDIKNPLAGIAGVLDIIGRDLPAGSPALEVLPDVQNEIERIEKLLAEFAKTQ
ncbi:MAG: hypothetical protein LAN37_14240 [Acidobacteriia bacterium]|nr:hypothetical protein [Terriglobia bacterium]